MTICAAALAYDLDGPLIVATADTRVSWGHDSIDTAVKIRRINSNWIACFSADDVSTLETVVADLRNAVGNRVSLPEVRNACKNLHGQISTKKYAWHFLVCGFDAEGKPHIFKIADKASDCDMVGFGSIGSGTYLADYYFCSYSYEKTLPMSEVIYCVLAAKFTAERADAISGGTMASIIRPGQTYFPNGVPVIAPNVIEEIRQKWESLPRLPDGVLDLIDPYLEAQKKFLF